MPVEEVRDNAEPAFPWTRADWLARANAWIAERLRERSITPVGEVEQPHVRWWSTVLRIRTDEGDLFFKAVAAPHAFEAPLTALLAREAPGDVPAVVAVDEDRAWMLFRDGGTRLRELLSSPADLGHWERLLPRYAELQMRIAPRLDDLLSLGVPDQRLATLEGDLARVIEERDLLLSGPEGLTPDEYARARASIPLVAELCSRLSAFGFPETLQHDDFHDGNVFVDGEAYRFFDWGDSCISHPFHTLVVTLRSVAYRFGLEPGSATLLRLRDAYLEPWRRHASPAELHDAFELAYRTGTIARTLAWHRYVTARGDAAAGDDSGAIAYGLRLFLADGGIGAFR